MRKTLVICFTTAALLTGGAALAQAPERGAMRGAEMTRDSVEQRAAQSFARMDVNSDGKLDAGDRAARANARFDAVDTNGDGAISREEFAAMRETRQDRRAERRAARPEGAPEAGKRMATRGPGMVGPRGRMGRGMAMLEQADSDNDGAISQAEFSAAALARFDAADKDGDGTVTREERREAQPQTGRMHRRSVG
jgi:Ca2+-binding EF-hand superfamily protein